MGLLMVAFGLLALIAIPCILWFGRKRSWKYRIGWSIASCLPLLGSVWFVGNMGVYDVKSREDLERGYEYELHRRITSDVHDLQIRRVGIGDGVGSWVRFRASSQTIDSLVKSFSPSDRSKFEDGARGANIPSWWEPEVDKMANYYYTEQWEPGCSTFSFAYLAHDATKQVVYFHHSGS